VDIFLQPINETILTMSTIFEDLQQCVIDARNRRQLARGLNEVARTLDQRRAVLCILSRACSEDNYSRLIVAMCAEHGIPMMRVDDSAVLGTWAGLVKYNDDGEVRKVVKTACVVIQQWGSNENRAQQNVIEYIRANSVK